MDTSKYAALFLAESREHLRACNQLLLAWEKAPDQPEAVNGLFRAIHTIKGMAATLGYTTIADVAHRAENLLDAVRARRVEATPAGIELLFRAVDAIEAGVDAAEAGTAAPLDAGLLEALDQQALPEGMERRASTDRRRAAVPVPAAPEVAVAGLRAVTVTIRPDAALRGARATIALRRAEALGAVSGVRPPAAEFGDEAFDGRFQCRFLGQVSDAELQAAILGAGDVDSVEVERVEAAVAQGPVAAARQVRIDLARLDAMMQLAGELVVARNRLLVVAQHQADDAMLAACERLSRLVGAMQDEVVAARMTPVSEVFDRFPRIVRDLGRDLGKQVRFEVEGGGIELDRSILEEIGDPLLHLVRNAIDHGLELPAEREAAGKRPEGRIALAAERERSSVVITVSDDGRGIDRDRVLAKARREGVVDASVETLSDDLLLRVLSQAGFSTAERVSGVSGRGVGVDVVLTRLRQLGGSVEVQSERGRGTTFRLRVPLTLAIVRALMAGVGDERYCVPLAYVAETLDYDPGAVTMLRDREALIVRDRVVPTVHLQRVLGVAGPGLEGRRPSILVAVGDRRAALVVDRLLGQQDIVVEGFDAPAGLPAWFSGATILADGDPALILDAAAFV